MYERGSSTNLGHRSGVFLQHLKGVHSLYTRSRRQQAGRIGGLRTAALHDPVVTGAPGRTAATAALDARLTAEIDPQGILSEKELAKRLARARSAYFRSLSLKAQVTRDKRSGIKHSEATN